ncbi:hypothetical protein GQX74_000102 [Glossina fuscipes]|nr:hypothetical protein GQX74_000102 [Glossina fuscipes]
MNIPQQTRTDNRVSTNGVDTPGINTCKKKGAQDLTHLATQTNSSSSMQSLYQNHSPSNANNNNSNVITNNVVALNGQLHKMPSQQSLEEELPLPCG